jgi:hypothetical protein
MRMQRRTKNSGNSIVDFIVILSIGLKIGIETDGQRTAKSSLTGFFVHSLVNNMGILPYF